MTEDRQLHLRGALGAVRVEQYAGREHLVVPVIALMDGVIHAVNASMPERVTTATLTKAAPSWNGRPLVLGHPTKDGRQCSANEPAIEATHRFGTIFNSRVSGTRLLMDAYVDPVRAEQIGGAEFVRKLRAGEQIEVSVGAYVQTGPEQGVHNGRAYKAVWLETHGDHLAFLPGGRGACSIEMGCGAHRAAEAMLITAEGWEPRALWPNKDGHDDHGRGEGGGAKPFKKGDRVTVADTHHDPRFRGQQGSVYSSATSAEGKPTHYVKMDSGRGQFVHADELISDNASEDDDFDIDEHIAEQAKLRPGLKLNDDKWAEFRKNRPVKRRLASRDCETCQGTGQVKKDEKQQDCPSCEGSGYKAAEDGGAAAEEIQMKKVDAIKALTSCPCSGFVAADAKELETFSEERLTAMAEAATARKAEQDKSAADLKAAQEAAETLRAAAAKTPTEEEYLAKAPESIRTLVAEKKAQDAATKADLVAKLKTAAAGVFTEEELNAKSLGELSKLAQMAKVDADFSGRALPVQPRAASEAKQYAPPDPYEAGIKALQGSKTVN